MYSYAYGIIKFVSKSSRASVSKFFIFNKIKSQTWFI